MLCSKDENKWEEWRKTAEDEIGKNERGVFNVDERETKIVRARHLSPSAPRCARLCPVAPRSVELALYWSTL